MIEPTFSPERNPSPGQNRPWWWVGVPICLLFVALVLLASFLFRSGIHVTIKNDGSQPLRSVVLHVTGADFNLGDIAPGDTASAAVAPTGESHLEIQFADPDGQANRLDAGGYFESGYKGTIRVSIKDEVIQGNEQNIKLPWSLP